LTEEEYENKKLTSEIDKVFAIASQHVKLDSEKAFSQIIPLVQQLLQSMQQLAPKPQLPPEAMVLRETSMAETERRAKKDSAEIDLKTQQMQQDAAQEERQEQLDIALNSVDNLTKERIETARLTQKDQELQNEQFETAIRLQQEVQRKLGEI
jgi:arginine utilization protein RocB